MNLESSVQRELYSKLYARRIPFNSFILGKDTAAITVVLQSPAGSLSMPFAIRMVNEDNFIASSTAESIEAKTFSQGCNWIVGQVRRMETRIGKFRL